MNCPQATVTGTSSETPPGKSTRSDAAAAVCALMELPGRVSRRFAPEYRSASAPAQATAASVYEASGARTYRTS